MTKLEILERYVQSLSLEELAAFRGWFAEYDWAVWDQQLESDVAAGRLDGLAAEALDEHRRGNTKPL
ncbi:MAG TPA: hypothetical protein VNM92_03930 [Thermoanaerobaculia bacterium]|nr:hypothetical protein [Thermoanaerobaculia bacterium]